MFEQWRIPITVIPLCLVCHAVGRNLSRNLKFKSENQHDKTDRQVIPDSIRAVSFLELVQLVWRLCSRRCASVNDFLYFGNIFNRFSFQQIPRSDCQDFNLFLQWINNDRRLTFLLNNSKYNRNYIKKLNVMDTNKSRKIFNLIADD